VVALADFHDASICYDDVERNSKGNKVDYRIVYVAQVSSLANTTLLEERDTYEQAVQDAKEFIEAPRRNQLAVYRWDAFEIKKLTKAVFDA